MTNVRALLCALGAAAVVLPFAVGCSSSSDPEPADTTTTVTTETTAATVTAETTSETTEPAGAPPGSYAACLAEQGIDAPVDPALGPPPGPAPPPPGVDENTWQQAVQTCTDLVAGTAGG